MNRRWALSIGLLLALIPAFLGGRALARSLVAVVRPTHAVLPDRLKASLRPGLGVAEELRLVLVASGSCAACNNVELPNAIAGAKEVLQELAASRQMGFSALGVGVDALPATGIEELERFGTFDEIAVGGGWANLGAIEYLWMGHPGQGAVPQVLVLHRAIETTEARIQQAETTVLNRMVGIDEILLWRARGFPVALATVKMLDELRPDSVDLSASGSLR